MISGFSDSSTSSGMNLCLIHVCGVFVRGRASRSRSSTSIPCRPSNVPTPWPCQRTITWLSPPGARPSSRKASSSSNVRLSVHSGQFASTHAASSTSISPYCASRKNSSFSISLSTLSPLSARYSSRALPCIDTVSRPPRTASPAASVVGTTAPRSQGASYGDSDPHSPIRNVVPSSSLSISNSQYASPSRSWCRAHPARLPMRLVKCARSATYAARGHTGDTTKSTSRPRSRAISPADSSPRTSSLCQSPSSSSRQWRSSATRAEPPLAAQRTTKRGLGPASTSSTRTLSLALSDDISPCSSS